MNRRQFPAQVASLLLLTLAGLSVFSCGSNDRSSETAAQAQPQPGSAPAPKAEQPAPGPSTPQPVSTPPEPPVTKKTAPAAEKALSSAAVQTAGGLPDVDAHATRGSKSAPIIMETFSDYQCPACKQLYLGTYAQLMDNYVTTGKVYSIHRDFPLPGHAYSRIAARYGRAAAQLGRLEQVQEVLFQNQEKWEQTGDVDGTVSSVVSPAEMTKLRALVKNAAIDEAIEKDVTLGKSYNVNQTPTTVIHYKGQTYPVVGIVSYDVLHQFLDQLLAQR